MKKESKSVCGPSESCGCGDVPAPKAKREKKKPGPAKKSNGCAPRKRCGS